MNPFATALPFADAICLVPGDEDIEDPFVRGGVPRQDSRRRTVSTTIIVGLVTGPSSESGDRGVPTLVRQWQRAVGQILQRCCGTSPIRARSHHSASAVDHRPGGVIAAMDLDMRQSPRSRRRALGAPAVIGVLLVLGGCGGSGGNSLPSRTASAELPTVSRSIDRTELVTSTTVEAPATEPTPARTPLLSQTDTSAENTPSAGEDTSTETTTPPIESTQPATTRVTQTTQV